MVAKVRVYYGIILDTKNNFYGLEKQIISNALKEFQIEDDGTTKMEDIKTKYPTITDDEFMMAVDKYLNEQFDSKIIKTDYIYFGDYIGFIIGVKLTWVGDVGITKCDISNLKQYNNDLYNIMRKFDITAKPELITAVL